MFKRLSIYRKTLVLGLAPLGIFLLVVYAYLLPAFGRRYLEARKDGARQVVETAFNLVQGLEARVQKGELTREQAQQQATGDVLAMRYDGDNYLCI